MSNTAAEPNFWVLIPARMGAGRLPGKPLADLAGEPMVVRVAKVAQSAGAARVVVATDSEAISQAVHEAGVESILTRADHASGTDRLAEAVALLGAQPAQLVVNLQGDEPLMPPEALRLAAQALQAHPQASVSTAVTPMVQEDICNPNQVKAVCDQSGMALYFSRAPIPFWRDPSPSEAPPARVLRHLGLYAYRAGPLSDFWQWGPCGLETMEQLEQLRWLHRGHRIATFLLETPPPPGVDTPEDLERMRAILKASL